MITHVVFCALCSFLKRRDCRATKPLNQQQAAPPPAAAAEEERKKGENLSLISQKANLKKARITNIHKNIMTWSLLFVLSLSDMQKYEH